MTAKILIWDIEASSLVGDYGYCFCIGYKWFGDKGAPKLITIRNSPTFKKDTTNDKYVVEEFAKVFSQADASVAHFGTFFDPLFVNTRLLVHGLPPLPPVPMIDTWKTAKKKLKLRSNRLNAIFEAFGIEAEKTRLDPKSWVRGAAGHIPSLKYIEDHCIKDVDALEKVYAKLRPLMLDIPNVAVIEDKEEGCPRCAAEALIQRGYLTTKTGKKARFQCKACGGWSHSRKIEKSKVKHV